MGERLEISRKVTEKSLGTKQNNADKKLSRRKCQGKLKNVLN